jgi:hypothetical protein
MASENCLLPHSFRQAAREFETLADQSSSPPEVVQSLRNLAKIWDEIADIIGESNIIGESKCPICFRETERAPGTVYCAQYHGFCGVCNGPRVACRCFKSQLMENKYEE